MIHAHGTIHNIGYDPFMRKFIYVKINSKYNQPHKAPKHMYYYNLTIILHSIFSYSCYKIFFYISRQRKT